MGSIIGLQGPAKSGKDTVADYILTKDGWDEKLSFASNLKEMCQAIFFLTDAQVNTQEGKQTAFPEPKVFTSRNLGSVLYWMSRTHSHYPLAKGAREYVATLVDTELLSPRHVLQFIGTDLCRSVIPTYHLDIVSQVIEENPDKNYVITDVRFPNEGDLLVDNFSAEVFQVSRPSNEELSLDRSHASETSMSDWGRFSGVINNDKQGLSFLFDAVNSVLEGKFKWQTTEITPSLGNLKETSSPTVEAAGQRSIGTTMKTPLTDVG